MDELLILPENTRLEKKFLSPENKVIEILQASMTEKKASEYVSGKSQYNMLQKIQDSFVTGSLAAYKDSQRTWVNDKSPPVKTVIGFVEPYRDTLGIRSEFEGITSSFANLLG
ncbi:hypothetical protein EYZ11_006284 [Aspergillus tanneri]|uniref:Uncharacterized protein n=1 Tax=Aspergillus tanneri TaxID=1220188 RepID=A0A4S3JFV8_9EURO|nr:hypothetical protein EYZ11_006284 [Aspergillus tanneri]